MCHLPSTSMIRLAIAACVVLTINPIGCTVATSAKPHGIKRLRQDNDGRESRQPPNRDDGWAAHLVEMEVVGAQSSPDHSAFLSVDDGDKGYISGEETPHHLLDDSEDLKGESARQLETIVEYKRLRPHEPSTYKQNVKELTNDSTFNYNLSATKAGKSTKSSASPSISPRPSFVPSISSSPSDEPSMKPSPEPSIQPSISSAPTDEPSFQPSISTEPSISTAPSSQPSTRPSISTAPSTSAKPSVSGKPSSVPSTSSQPSSSSKPSFSIPEGGSKAGKGSKTSKAR
mmetsp:Transcript_43316/g.79280  ORF Transcript_43316/g.79280 Transcript_43316/m.79280 type:complete len:287 (-) Transcript_43316:190-1050(-)